MGFYMFIAQKKLRFLHLVIPTTTVHDGIFNYGTLYTYIIFCIEITILDITILIEINITTNYINQFYKRGFKATLSE